ncbi:MAG: hypothetical protein KC731_03645, partial [Myxococcales bacterium]|nr:hypothetical protein [Myxococcales bacterium]
MTEPKRPRRGSRSLRQILSATVLATAALTTWAACSTKPTEIVAGVTTQLQVPKYLKTVGIAVQLGGRLVFCEAYPVYDGSVTLPSTIGVVPAEGDSPTEPVTVQILGFRTEQSQFANDCIANIPDVGDDEDGDGTPEVMVVRRRRLPYDPDRIVYLPMPLRESCAEVRCGDDETCLGGVCEPADVDPATLEDYDDSFVFGNTNTCFDPSRCLPEQALVPALLEDEAKCTYRVPWPMDAPAPTPGDMNVRIVYDTFGTEILDLDPIEGFIMPDPQDPLLIQLAPNMCEGVVKKGRMLAIQAAPLCPAKRPLQPICDGALSAIVQAQNAVVGGGQESLCTQASLLVPTESALYVLMDRSQSMSEFYGPDGLNVAINTPLENPIAKETRVGLSPLPATSCDAENQFATNLLVPFGKVDAVRAPIGSFLGDPMLQADAPLHLEAA